jgi:hypothetical protein
MRYFLAFALLLILVFSTYVSAGIISVDCQGEGAIIINDWWTSDLTSSPADADIFLDEKVHGTPAKALVTITADSDPTARFTKEVDNATVYSWIGYVITVTKSSSFSITSATEPIGWATPVITPPVEVVPGGDWVGSVSYSQGTGAPIAPGNTGVFKFTTVFGGNASFCIDQLPLYIVPEPGTIALLACGFIGLLVMRRRLA